MISAIRVAPLSRDNRADVESIVRATGVFSDDEVNVALEVFDSGTAEYSATASQSASGYELVGAFRDDTLVGYACFGHTPATDGTYDLYWIAVHPSAQRTGAGAALVTAAESSLRQRQARMLVIETSSRDDYAPTRRFYQARGYQESARLRDFYAPGDDRVVLTRRLRDVPGPADPDHPPTRSSL